MPSWTSAGDFARELGEFQRKLEREYARELAFRSAKRGQRIAREAAAGDLRGDPKFSGWKPRLATVIKQKPDGRAFLIPTKTSAGPWTVAEKGRNQGGGFRNLAQGPGVNLRTGRTSRRRDGSILISGRRTRAARRWNGVTQGKNTASDAQRRMESDIAASASRLFKRQIERHFDVT